MFSRLRAFSVKYVETQKETRLYVIKKITVFIYNFRKNHNHLHNKINVIRNMILSLVSQCLDFFISEQISKVVFLDHTAEPQKI